MHSILLISTLLSFAPLPPEPPPAVLLGVEAIPVTMLAIFVHESGHAFTGLALNLKVTKFAPWPTVCGDSFAWGCTEVQGNITPIKQLLVSSGGMLSTRITAELLDAAMNNMSYEHKYKKQFLALTYFFMRLDMPRYIVSSAVRSWVNRPAGPTNDPQSVVEVLSNNRMHQKWIYGGLVFLTIVDLIADREELKANWRRAWLKETVYNY